MNETSQTDLAGEEKVDANVMVGGKEIQAVTGDAEVESILGWIAIYTIGPGFTVDRKWLEENMEDLNISPEYLPSETTPKRAHTRASQLLVQNTSGVIPEGVEADVTRDGYSTFNLEITDRRMEGEINMEVIGDLNYDSGSISAQAKTGNPEYLDFYQRYAQEWKEMYETHLASNMGKDIRKMIRNFMMEHSTSVRMRDGGAVYFVPAHYDEMLSGFKELVERIDEQWKDMGHSARIDTVEVIDSPAKREMVEAKVRKSLEDVVEGIVDEALDELDEDRAANEVVSELADELSKAENMAVEHNTLLNADISVRQSLESWKEEVASDKEELVEKLVNEVDV